MSTSISSQTANKNTLESALNDLKSGDVNNDEISESQEIEAPAGLGGLPLNETARTVFEDPTTFNVKHPLYSSWTLWYDSPATKGKPGAPPTPATSVPPTPMSAQGMGWMEDIKRVVSFGSVEEFWGVYNNIVPPSHLPQKANYYLFKEGIMPAWEDDANKNGGKWSIQFPRDKTRERIDKFWLFTMLAAIGETFDATFSAAQNPEVPPEHAPPVSLVTGVIVSTRPQFYRLSIWTRLSPLSGPANGRPIPNGSTPIPVHPSEEGEPLRERIESIGKCFKMNVLGFQENQKLVGPLATEVEFASHKDTDRKAKNTKKLVV